MSDGQVSSKRRVKEGEGLREIKKEPFVALLTRAELAKYVLSWSKRLECFAKQDPGRARQSS